MNRAEKRQLITDMLRARPGWSNRRIATELGTDHKTVAAGRRKLEEAGEIVPYVRVWGRDRKPHPVDMSFWRERNNP